MSSFFKNVLKWGSAVAVVVIIYGVLTDLANIQVSWLVQAIGYISIVILPTGVVLGMYQLVKANRFNTIRAISTGLMIALISAVILMSYRMGRDALVDKFGNVDGIVAHERYKMEKVGAEESKIIAKEREIKEEYEGTVRPYSTTLKWYMALGSVYTIISYLILMFKVKRNEKITT